MHRHLSFRPEVNFTTSAAEAHVTKFGQIG
jgi:hypothetical protein